MTDVYLEVGAKRVFACSVEWPGWCRSGRDEAGALAALEAYAPRYRSVLDSAGIGFDPGSLTVVERVRGNATTDFGAPGVVPDLDRGPVSAAVARRQADLLAAAWRYFDAVVAKAPAELRKGPRGGGRDRDKIVEHVVGAEQSYASKIGIRPATATREAIAAVLREPGPALPAGERGWPTPYVTRRMAWHVLDHAWEIEDRST